MTFFFPFSTPTKSFVALSRPPPWCSLCSRSLCSRRCARLRFQFSPSGSEHEKTHPTFPLLPKSKTESIKNIQQRRRRRAPRSGRRLARDRVGPHRHAVRRLQVPAHPRVHRVPRHDLALLQGANWKGERWRERDVVFAPPLFFFTLSLSTLSRRFLFLFPHLKKKKTDRRTSTTTPSATSSSSAPAPRASRAPTSSPRTPRSGSRSSSRASRPAAARGSAASSSRR